MTQEVFDCAGTSEVETTSAPSGQTFDERVFSRSPAPTKMPTGSPGAKSPALTRCQNRKVENGSTFLPPTTYASTPPGQQLVHDGFDLVLLYAQPVARHRSLVVEHPSELAQQTTGSQAIPIGNLFQGGVVGG